MSVAEQLISTRIQSRHGGTPVDEMQVSTSVNKEIRKHKGWLPKTTSGKTVWVQFKTVGDAQRFSNSGLVSKQYKVTYDGTGDEVGLSYIPGPERLKKRFAF